MVKFYRLTYNVGRIKYLVSYHNGVKTYHDGSPFSDIAFFSNQKAARKFIRSLKEQGYQER